MINYKSKLSANIN